MMKIDNKLKIFFLVILFLITFGIYGGIRVFKSYSYVSNTEQVRTIIKNMGGFYYDRGGYIQYDSLYMDDNKTVKRSSEFNWIDANRDTIKYVDQISFINNVFKYGIGFDLKNEIDELSINGLINFGKEIYQEKEIDDDRLNVSFNEGEYQIDYYDNEVVRLSGSMMAIQDNHYLVMYHTNDGLNEIEKTGIFQTLKDSLYEGDLLVTNEDIFLYVGNDMFMYASGEDYDYINGVDKSENRAIKLITFNDLEKVENDKYLFNSQEFFVYRFLNKSGYWNKLPSSYKELSKYYSNELLPKIKIEKYSSKVNGSDVYQDEVITMVIKVTNNSDNKIVVPVISETLNLNDVEYISNNYIDEAYMDGVLTFTEVSIDGNSSREISYQVKVIKSDGNIIFDQTMIGEYKLNEITYLVGKKMDMTRLINGQSDIFTNYKRLYGITVNEMLMSEENSKITVSNLYGGRKLNGYDSRVRKINMGLLLTGDIILYNNEVVMYVSDGNDAYLVSRDNIRIEIDSTEFINSLLSKDKFQIIRPSYLYDELSNKIGELVVDEEKLIIHVKNRCTYQDIINYIDKDMQVEVKDNKDNVLDKSELIKSGSKMIMFDKEYYISLLGDINGDGLINTGDVLKLHRYVLGKIAEMEKYYLVSSYINSDNLINTGDVLKLHRYVLGKIENLE